MKSYIKSFFSVKKLFYKGVSPLCVWDKESSFPKKSNILAFSKLKNVRLGEFSRIGKKVNVANTTIGKFSAIGMNCQIGIGGHPTNYLSTNNIFYKKGEWGFNDYWVRDINNKSDDQIIIGNDVWIGLNCIVMDGVTIGDGAVVGAGSIVTKDIPAYSIAVGIPAKVVKYRFSESIIKRLEEIKWWECSEEKITSFLPVFHTYPITENLLNNFFKK